MPFFRLETNVKREDIPENFPKELVHVLAQTIGVDDSRIVLSIMLDQMMIFGEVGKLGSVGTFRSIGRQGEEQNATYAKAISNKITELGIDPNCQYIKFFDMPGHSVAMGSSTFSHWK